MVSKPNVCAHEQVLFIISPKKQQEGKKTHYFSYYVLLPVTTDIRNKGSAPEIPRIFDKLKTINQIFSVERFWTSKQLSIYLGLMI